MRPVIALPDHQSPRSQGFYMKSESTYLAVFNWSSSLHASRTFLVERSNQLHGLFSSGVKAIPRVTTFNQVPNAGF